MDDLTDLERELAAQIRGLEFGDRQPDAEKVWAGVSERVESANAAAAVSAKEGSRGLLQGTLRRWVGYTFAMAAVLIVAIAGITRQISKRVTPSVLSSTAQARFTEYRTQPGQRAKVTLKDGTRVMLNVASRLQVPVDFGIVARDVTLDGEAQFTVVHNAKKPFTVRAHGTLIRDLATVFSVRAYNTSGSTRVAVREGRVAMQSPVVTPNNAVTINALQVATLSGDAIPVVSNMTDAAEMFGWTHGELVLHHTPLSEALVDLSRWYGMEFQTADSGLLAFDISGKLPARYDHNYLRHMMDVIGATAVRNGNTVTIRTSPRGTP